MPAMANITIKKADGTTDVVYTSVSGAPGDNAPARWEVTAANVVRLFRPVFDLLSRWNAKKDARHLQATLKYPDVRAVNSVDTVFGNVIVNISAVVPTQVTDTVVTEAVAQAANMFKATLIQDSFKSGYSPN